MKCRENFCSFCSLVLKVPAVAQSFRSENFCDSSKTHENREAFLLCSFCRSQDLGYTMPYISCKSLISIHVATYVCIASRLATSRNTITMHMITIEFSSRIKF